MLVKNRRKKVRKSFFSYSHEYCYQKMGEKSAKQFFQKLTNSANKKCWGKNRQKKVRKTFLYIHTNTLKKMVGENKRESIFPETHE